MTKSTGFAIFLIGLAACYTPLNNSGTATTKPWLEIAARKTDFNGKTYDFCYRFNLRFWPPEAAEQIRLQNDCISSCCWSSEKEEVTLDFNKNFESELAATGRARRYTPGSVSLRVHYASWLNTVRVSVSPRGSITNDGLVKLTYKEYENPVRIARLEEEARQAAAREKITETTAVPLSTPAVQPAPRKSTPKQAPAAVEEKKDSLSNLSKNLLQRKAGSKIDAYFYQMDKRYKKQGAFFLLSERVLHTQSIEENTFMVSCLAKARTGMDAAKLQASTFFCGQWLVDLSAQTVTPYDKRAKLIWEETSFLDG